MGDALPGARASGNFEELKATLKSSSALLHTIITSRRGLADTAEAVEKYAKFYRAFTWLHESFAQLEQDYHRPGLFDKPAEAEFFLHLILRKRVECELQLAELQDLRLESQRKEQRALEAQSGMASSEQRLDQSSFQVDALRIDSAYESAVASLGRILPLLGITNCLDGTQIRVRMLSGLKRLQQFRLKNADILENTPERDAESLYRQTARLLKHTRAEFESTQAFLERQLTGEDIEHHHRYAKQLEILARLREQFDAFREEPIGLRQIPAGTQAVIAPSPSVAPECPMAVDSMRGWKAFAAEHRLDVDAIGEERLWILSPLQRLILEKFYGVGATAGETSTPIRDWGELSSELARLGHPVLGPEKVCEQYEFAVRHLKLFQSGMHWIACLCECKVQDVRNRPKSASIAEAEAALLYFGIGGPRQASEHSEDSPEPALISTFLGRIRGSLGDALHSLRRHHKQSALSPRLQSLLTDLFRPETAFTEAQISSHLKSIAAFNDWQNAERVLDLALSCAKYTHYQGVQKEALFRGMEAFLRAIPPPLWHEPPLSPAIAREGAAENSDNAAGDGKKISVPVAESAMEAILRTVRATGQVNFLGEIILGTQQRIYSTGGTSDAEKYNRVGELFVTSMYVLVVGISREFTGPVSREDLIQEAISPLMAAVKSYDPALGLRFSSHAYWPIKNAMKRHNQRAVRELTGLSMKTQDQLHSFERDCERAGIYPLNSDVSNAELLDALNNLPGATPRSLGEVDRLRALFSLANRPGPDSRGEYLRGSKISLHNDLDVDVSGDAGGAPEREIADERVTPHRDPEAAPWIRAALRDAWEEKLFATYLDQKQLDRDLGIFKAIHFAPKTPAAHEIAAVEGISAKTVSRACVELRNIFLRKSLSLDSPDSEIFGALRDDFTNVEILRRNLRIFRVASRKQTTSADVALKYGVDESNVRLIHKKFRQAAEKLSLGECGDAELTVNALRADCTLRARRQAAAEAEKRLLVVERVASPDEETHESIGTSFGFSGSLVRYILVQTRELAATLNLR